MPYTLNGPTYHFEIDGQKHWVHKRTLAEYMTGGATLESAMRAYHDEMTALAAREEAHLARCYRRRAR